jgi:hypothetical protein
LLRLPPLEPAAAQLLAAVCCLLRLPLLVLQPLAAARLLPRLTLRGRAAAQPQTAVCLLLCLTLLEPAAARPQAACFLLQSSPLFELAGLRLAGHYLLSYLAQGSPPVPPLAAPIQSAGRQLLH